MRRGNETLDWRSSQLIDLAIEEDVGDGDVTTEATVPATGDARARIVQKAEGCVFGHAVAAEVFNRVDVGVKYQPACAEGEWRGEGLVALIEGPAQGILTGERTVLNFLGHLSGVATAAARAVKAVEGTGTQILDTRKTIPGLRQLEKLAVAAAGGTNHRHGLYDAVLIKENHIAAAGSITAAIGRFDEPGAVEVEVENSDQIDEALTAGATHLLLDNMTDQELRAAVQRVAGRAKLEASGGYTLENLRSAAETGVDFISLGSITHSAPSLDLSLLFEQRA